MSNIRTARDDVRTAVNGLAAVVGAGVTASAEWIPQRDRADITGLEIVISATERTITLAGRGGQHTDDMTVSVGIWKPLGDDPDATAEQIHTLAETIAKDLLGVKLATAGTITGASVAVVLNPDDWREKRLASAAVDVLVRI